MKEEELFKRIGRVFPPGTIICQEGETGREMYVILTGKVKITKKVRGMQKTLATLGPGDILGEMSVLNQKPRSATALVLEESKILVVEPKMFEAMIRGNIEIAVRLIKLLAKRLQDADDQIESLLIKDSNSRVINALSSLAEREKRSSDGGIRISITTQGLADKIGLDENRVKDILEKIITSNTIAIEPDGFLIKDLEKLKKFLEFLPTNNESGEG